TSISSKVAMEQIHHGPQMATFFDVDLEQVAQVVHGRSSQAQVTLLFDGGRLGVALGHDDATQVGAVLSRSFLPHILAFVFTKVNLALAIKRSKENSPTVL